jgi:hypothetical protein
VSPDPKDAPSVPCRCIPQPCPIHKSEPAVPEELQRAADDAVDAWRTGYSMCPHHRSLRQRECDDCLAAFIASHVLAAKVCTEPEHQRTMAAVGARLCFVTRNPCGSDTWPVGDPCSCWPCGLYRAEAAEQALAATQAELNEARRLLGSTHDHWENTMNERDTYKARLEQALRLLSDVDGCGFIDWTRIGCVQKHKAAIAAVLHNALDSQAQQG